ncbi:hypothetical protein KI387_028438 [Taxus chinensis]|uniref:4-coumarate--CoA ligase n=1 Tax=Taxus chinensis TaxID=29808 RepID=A0AA38FCY9_TAXCH|nr:hypothetical protein KI387_028438 [Taxus chinensis]
MANSSNNKTPNFHIDPNSGFCESNGIYYSKRNPVSLPSPHQQLDITTYIFSHDHNTDIAFIDAPSGTRLSYSALRSNVKALAAGLRRLGIRKRDMVLLISPNSIHIPGIYLAVLSIGAIVTTSNPVNTEADIQNQVRDSNPVIIFTVPYLLQKLGSTATPIVLIGETESPNSSSFCRLSALLGAVDTDLGTESIDQGVRKSEPVRQRVAIKQEDTATLLYSSGTTGKSKGVILTHRNYIAIIAANRARYEMQGVYLCSIPLFHIYGLRFTLCSLAAGATIVVMPKFDMNEMLHNIEKYRVTLLPTVPTVLSALAKSSEVTKYDLSSLQQIGLGGAPVGMDVMKDFSAKFPRIQLRQGYGLTETTASVVYTNSDEENLHYGSVGLLSDVVEAKVVDPVSAKALPPNHRGELWLRGPTVMKEQDNEPDLQEFQDAQEKQSPIEDSVPQEIQPKMSPHALAGYFGNKEATLATLDLEGWLKTGDLCYIDQEGFVFVVDRLKDMIKYKAHQVAPAELEELLLTRPEISEAAVIPYPDQEAGQIPMAYIVKNSHGKLSEKDVINFIAKQKKLLDKIILAQGKKFVYASKEDVMKTLKRCEKGNSRARAARLIATQARQHLQEIKEKMWANDARKPTPTKEDSME